VCVFLHFACVCRGVLGVRVCVCVQVLLTLALMRLEEYPCILPDSQPSRLLAKFRMACVSVPGMGLSTSGMRKSTMHW
jgi:hypothetical protein